MSFQTFKKPLEDSKNFFKFTYWTYLTKQIKQ